jgi:transposase
VDVHYEFSTVALVNDASRVVCRERLEHRDRERLRRRLSDWPSGLSVVMEASFGWGWLSDLMDEVGLKVRLSNCYKVEQMRKARGEVKTNDKDAALLAPLPREASNWWEVWRAPAEVRDRREWMRHRMDLVNLQTQTKCRVHAIFHRHGIFHDFSDLFGAGGRKFLKALCEGEDRQSVYLRGGSLEALRGDVALLLHLRQELARIAAHLRKELDRSESVRWLVSVPGFGLILAHVVLAEVGVLDRFGSARALASYSLLAPRSRDTGAPLPADRTPLGRHLGHRGNRTLKWAFIEAAHGAVRSGGVWRAMFNRATDGGRRDRGHGYVKVARALVAVVYAVLRDRRMYQAQRPSPRGQTTKESSQPTTESSQRMKQSQRSSSRTARPGTGRPSRPMVAAGCNGRGTSS